MPALLQADVPHLRSDGGRLVVAVAWGAVDRLQALLRRHGVRAPACQDSESQRAWLLLWHGADVDAARAALAVWQG
jgi:hypothetical protein